MKTFWKYIDGNKTIICFGVATLLQQALKYDIIKDSNVLQFIIGTFLLLGGGSLGHHVKKGYFSTKKGQ